MEANIKKFIDAVLRYSDEIRYVAIIQKNTLYTKQRSSIESASHSESDKYEELFVNPALLLLATNRGNLDCGGLQCIIVRYGNFQQLVVPCQEGHLSICFELNENPATHLAQIKRLMTQAGIVSPCPMHNTGIEDKYSEQKSKKAQASQHEISTPPTN